MDNASITGDSVAYHSGGIKSMGKFSIAYGKVEVRAKFTQGQGSWPAIWMMPEPATAHSSSWPACGEIDIMEHVNLLSNVSQTLHNSIVTNANGGSSATVATAYNVADYNIYSVSWDPSAVKFYVNNALTYTYNKVSSSGWQQYPYDVPFYIILNQSGGAGWPGAITNSNLPFSMDVDYVRVYKLSQMTNGGFETGTISPWTSWGGTVTAVTGNARTGSYSIKETGAECSAEQIVTGLSPNTTYIFSGWGKVSAQGQSVTIGVKNYGGSSVGTPITTTAYSQGSVSFTTGSTNTSATLYFYKPAAGTIYGDDFYLEKQ
jgi:beta-glucanase (GH16 family)